MPKKTARQQEPWMGITWNAKDLPEEEAAARHRLDLAGLKAVVPIRSQVHKHLMPYVRKPATIQKVLPPILGMIDEAHEAFLRAAVEQLSREPGAALIEAAAEDWIAEDAQVAVQQITWTGLDGLMKAEIPLDDPALGREKIWRPQGDQLIAYACGLKPDFRNGEWSRAIHSKLEAQLSRLWPVEGQIRALLTSRAGKAPANYIRAAEAARMVQVDTSTVTRWAANGDINSHEDIIDGKKALLVSLSDAKKRAKETRAQRKLRDYGEELRPKFARR